MCKFHQIGFSCGCKRCEGRMLSRSQQIKRQQTARTASLMRTKPVAK